VGKKVDTVKATKRVSVKTPEIIDALAPEFSDTKTSRRSDVTTPRRRDGDATRQDGRQVRKKTLYLPVAVARRLELRAVQDDVTESRIVEQALLAFLKESNT
jgi:hypothetical protein